MTAAPKISFDATITDRGQTTVPAAIRKALGVQKGTITFKILSDNTVVIEPKQDEDNDPALDAFLSLLAKDIAKGKVVPMTSSLLGDIDSLVGSLDIDLDAPLTDE